MCMSTISERVVNYFDYDRLIDVYHIKIFNLYIEPKINGPMFTAAGSKTRFQGSEIKVYCYYLKIFKDRRKLLIAKMFSTT